jgi:hypothetical protein
MINSVAFAIGIALMILIVKASSFLAPFNLYFSISTLVVGGSELFSPWALLVKLAIPFLVGFLICFLPYKMADHPWVLNTKISTSLRDYASGYAVTTAQAAAFFGSLLLSWPMIVHWDILAAFEVRELRALFIVSYLVYFVAYGFMGGAGARTALALVKAGGAPQWIVSARDGAVGALAGGIATAVLTVFVGT